MAIIIIIIILTMIAIIICPWKSSRVQESQILCDF